MNIALRNTVGALIIALTVLVAGYAIAVQAARNEATPTGTPGTFERHTFFSATTTNATSTNLTGGGGLMPIAGAKKVNFYFTHGGAATTSTGSSIFNVQVTPDGTNWYDFNKLISNLGTSTANVTVLSTVAVPAATTTTIVGMDIDHDAFLAARCIVVEVGTVGQQGEHTCTATVEF